MSDVLDLGMPVWRAMFPHAPQAVIDQLFAQQQYLDDAGLTSNRRWLIYCFANIGEETGGFTIPNLTESDAYSPARAAQIWPNRFPVPGLSPSAPGATFGERLFNTVYANRMGNGPPYTGDGARYRGRGGPQLTGADEYGLIGRATGLPLRLRPEMAGDPIYQDQIIGAYWTTKGLSKYADSGNFQGLVRAWNGGLIGYADRVAYLNRLTPIVTRLAFVNHIDKVLSGNAHAPIDDIASGQQALNDVRAKYAQGWAELVVDGQMGPATHAAVVAYQSWHVDWRDALDVDGLLGPKTYAALQIDLARK